MTAKEMELIYDTLLSSPGMADNVRIDVKISRKLVLMLSQVMERGLQENLADGGDFLKLLPKEAVTELLELTADFLDKAGLKPLSDKLKGLYGK